MRFDPVECGMRIRSLRENRGFTRIQFAEQISISPDHLKAIERGKGPALLICWLKYL